MKATHTKLFIFLSLGLAPFALCIADRISAAPQERSAAPTLLAPDISFRNEVQRAIDRGLAWLQANQNSNGYWSTGDQPAITGLALLAFTGEPNGRFEHNEPAWLQKG